MNVVGVGQEVPHYGNWAYLAKTQHKFLGSVNFDGHPCDLYVVTGPKEVLYVRFGPAPNDHRHAAVSDVKAYWGSLDQLTSKPYVVKGYMEAFNRNKAGHFITAAGGVCPKCGAEVKERALFFNTFVGCLC